MSDELAQFSHWLVCPDHNYIVVSSFFFIKRGAVLPVKGHFTAVPRQGEGSSILTALFDHIWPVWWFLDRLRSPGEKWTRDRVLPRPETRF